MHGERRSGSSAADAMAMVERRRRRTEHRRRFDNSSSFLARALCRVGKHVLENFPFEFIETKVNRFTYNI